MAFGDCFRILLKGEIWPEYGQQAITRAGTQRGAVFYYRTPALFDVFPAIGAFPAWKHAFFFSDHLAGDVLGAVGCDRRAGDKAGFLIGQEGHAVSDFF